MTSTREYELDVTGDSGGRGDMISGATSFHEGVESTVLDDAVGTEVL